MKWSGLAPCYYALSLVVCRLQNGNQRRIDKMHALSHRTEDMACEEDSSKIFILCIYFNDLRVDQEKTEAFKLNIGLN